MGESVAVTRADTSDRVRALLVEDSETAAEIVRRRLGESPWPRFELTHAPSLTAAEPLLGGPFDVVLLDLGLPECEGLDALSFVRARCALPIVVLTGQEDGELALRALEAEAQDYLVKRRIDTDTLVRAIRYAMGRHSILARLARALDDARGSEARLRALMSRSSDGIVVVDADGRAVLANPAAEELLGVGQAELVGRTLPSLDLTHDQSDHTLAAPSERVIDVRAVDVEWEGRPARLALLRDVTGRRQAEELRVQLERSERLAAIGQLAAGVAHEINNPLTYVCMSVEALLRRLPSSPEEAYLRERLHDAQEGLERVVRIVRDLRHFARVEPDPRPQPVSLAHAIEGALKLADPHLRHRARVEVELGELPAVRGTEGRLSQVFLNLLVNAAHAIEEGHVSDNRVLVRARTAGDVVIAEVCDTGRGVAPQHLGRLFEPFFTTKPDGESTGLGLSICRSIVNAYGGDISAESEVGVGTCIRVRLPVWSGTAPTSVRAPSSSGEHEGPRGRVLLVDDEPAILRALVDVLSEHHDVVTASSGNEARAILSRDGAFDAVLCDLLMGHGTGIELVVWLEASAPELAHRVVLMSGGATTPEAERFLHERAHRALAKPLAVADVLRKIREVQGPAADSAGDAARYRP